MQGLHNSLNTTPDRLMTAEPRLLLAQVVNKEKSPNPGDYIPSREINQFETTCSSCSDFIILFETFVDVIQVVSEALYPIMLVFFSLFITAWLIYRGYQIVLGMIEAKELKRDLFYLVLASALMFTVGKNLPSHAFKMSMGLMSGISAEILLGALDTQKNFKVAARPLRTNENAPGEYQGLQGRGYYWVYGDHYDPDADPLLGVIRYSERTARILFKQTRTFINSGSIMSDFTGAISKIAIGLLILIPYAYLLFLFQTKIAISIFRLMGISALTPFYLVMMTFDKGRELVKRGFHTLFASILIMTLCSIAFSIIIIATIHLLEARDVFDENSRSNQKIDVLGFDISEELKGFEVLFDPTILGLILIGWMGTALMVEAVGLANSLAGSHLSNAAAAVFTAGAVGTGLAAYRLTRNTASGAPNAAYKGAKSAFNFVKKRVFDRRQQARSSALGQG